MRQIRFPEYSKLTQTSYSRRFKDVTFIGFRSDQKLVLMGSDDGRDGYACRAGTEVDEERREQMKVLYKLPGFPPKERDIDNDLETLQQMVGGNIESVYIGDDVSVICNEEGKFLGLPPNFYVERIDDMIVGPAVFVRQDGEDLIDMTTNDINWICIRLGWRC